MIIREIVQEDLPVLLELYTHLHDNAPPIMAEPVARLWHTIVKDENHHILVAQTDDKIVSSCVLIIVPNLTHQQRPYALVENVVTHPQYRKRGFATQVLNFAREIAHDNRCYKMMLMTGSKEASTLHFYERAGYSSRDKTAFVQWLDG